MDPLSVVAGITGIAGFADTIVTKTYKFIAKAKNADASIRRFFAESSSLLSVLTGIHHTLQLMSEEKLLIDPSVGKQVDVCFSLVKEIRDALVDPELAKSSLAKLKRNLQWPFNSAKTEELVRSLERQKATLSLAFSTDAWYVRFGLPCSF